MSMNAAIKESQQAFETAIAKGYLSLFAENSRFIGDWMYMGRVSESNKAAFKNKISREYIYVNLE